MNNCFACNTTIEGEPLHIEGHPENDLCPSCHASIREAIDAGQSFDQAVNAVSTKTVDVPKLEQPAIAVQTPMPATPATDSTKNSKQKGSSFAKLGFIGAVMKIISSVIGMCIGAYATISAANISFGVSPATRSYGGDAYTGIQNAAAYTANNVYFTNEALQLLVSVIGLISIAFFLVKLCEGISELGRAK